MSGNFRKVQLFIKISLADYCFQRQLGDRVRPARTALNMTQEHNDTDDMYIKQIPVMVIQPRPFTANKQYFSHYQNLGF